MNTSTYRYLIAGIVIAVGGIWLLAALPSYAADVETVTKEQLKEMLNDPELVILDVRTGRDWTSSEFKIKGARRADPKELETWAKTLEKDQKLVLYCA